MIKRTRFAPSPSGLLHIGNAYSALQCEAWAKAHDAELILRIEDIDNTRCRPHFSASILDDLAWLDIHFTGEVVYQQQRLAFYASALQQLKAMGVLYACICSRKDIAIAAKKKSQQRHIDVQRFDHYPATCRLLQQELTQTNNTTHAFAWRINIERVKARLGEQLSWADFTGKKHTFLLDTLGDVVVGRKDITYSYHLSVVVDDALQGISHVIRGEDLRSSTPVHRMLQLLLGYASPVYEHHTLLLNHAGERLSKTKQSKSLKACREAGETAKQLRTL